MKRSGTGGGGRCGRMAFDERLVAVDPPTGTFPPGMPLFDRLTVTYDAPNYLPIEAIVVTARVDRRSDLPG